jgi:hypothetical protein
VVKEAKTTVPPFIPTGLKVEEKVEPTEPMVVLTVRIAPSKRDAIRLLWRNDPDINSVSQVVQLAIDEFLAKHA